MRPLEKRLQEVEQRYKPRRRHFVMFDESAFNADFDLEAEKDRLRRDEGMRDSDELTIVCWKIVDPPAHETGQAAS